jgi:hypothetical protein
MKKFVSVLLVLTMVLAVASAAVAACNIKAGMWVEFKKDSPAFTKAKSSKETNNVVAKGSRAKCDKVCGEYARLIVNSASNIKRWFKVADLKQASVEMERVIWAKGGKGMSTKTEISSVDKHLKGKYVKVSGHTNLRKSPSLHCASQGVVEKCKMLKLSGRTGFDDRDCLWFEVCYKGKKLWLSMWYIQTKPNDVAIQLYDKDGNKVNYDD